MNKVYIDNIIKTALLEDMNYADITTENMIDENQIMSADFLAKSDGVLCGIDAAIRVFEMLGDFKVKKFKNDKDIIKTGDVIATISGKTVDILSGERTALNLVQHMSGIATATARATQIARGTNAHITDTRKTLPGLRPLQKYAVACGGGKNHRFNLSDGAMLKDNHIDSAGGIESAIGKLRSKVGHMVKIEVETRTLDEVTEALSCGADIIMLDNMSNETMEQAVKMVAGKALLEASGNITEKTLRGVCETGVDIVSIGALTHSVKAFDISLKIKNHK